MKETMKKSTDNVCWLKKLIKKKEKEWNPGKKKKGKKTKIEEENLERKHE